MDETKPMILLGIDTPHVVDHKTLSNIIMGLSYSMYLVLLEANGRRSIFFKKKLNISMSLKLVLARCFRTLVYAMAAKMVDILVNSVSYVELTPTILSTIVHH